MNSTIVQALDAASDGYSADRVIADPELNARFISQCHSQGLTDSVAKLNRALLNLRKRGALAGRARSRRTHFADEEEYRFASEMAVRFLERRDGKTLDDIMCDPSLATEFDTLASRLVPGLTPLKYRWAALNLRKSHRLQPEIVARVAPPIEIRSFETNNLNPNEIPAKQGLYLLFISTHLLYVGEAENLRLRLKKHLDHSDNKGFARWLWESKPGELRIEVQVLEETTTTKVRKALELELIRSRQPIFNVKR